jgi:hypothetical protein
MPCTLGIRYCGGCRAGYDRAARVDGILRGLRARRLDAVPGYAGYAESAPVALLVCGCMAQCLLRDETLPRTWHYLGPDGHFDGVPASLETVVSVVHEELLKFF